MAENTEFPKRTIKGMIRLEPIGTVHTPYLDKAPFRPDENADGLFYLEVDRHFVPGLEGIEKHSHLIVLYYFDRQTQTSLVAHPPNHPGLEVGVFASRSPKRVSKIGINVVRLLRVEDNILYTSPMDAFDGSPLLDIKPYIPELDHMI